MLFCWNKLNKLPSDEIQQVKTNWIIISADKLVADYLTVDWHWMVKSKKQLRSRLRYAFKDSYIVDGAVDVSSKHQNVLVYVRYL